MKLWEIKWYLESYGWLLGYALIVLAIIAVAIGVKILVLAIIIDGVAKLLRWWGTF